MPGVFKRIGRKCRALFKQRGAGAEAESAPENAVPTSPQPANIRHFVNAHAGVGRETGMDGGSALEVAVPIPPSSANTNYFSNSNDFVIPNLYINSTHNASTVGTPDPANVAIALLEAHVSHGAAHNSDERCDTPACAPQTRRAVQEEIISWMRNGDIDDKPMKMMWLAGPAGSGKTAIAGSVAELCKEGNFLAATFFFSSFSRSADRRSKRCVVATLAYHLAKHASLHQFKMELLKAINEDQDIFRKHLKEQAHCLLLRPFRAIQGCHHSSSWPKSILIDGLDEVQAVQYNDTARVDEDDQLEILQVLHMLASDPAFPFRIFVASRPERVIEELFSSTAQDMTIKLFLDAKYNPNADIKRFLQSKFMTIRRRYGISDASWPGQRALDRILEMSSGQFIVPATIIRHIEAGVPQRQLDDIMQLKWEDCGRKNPFAVLDALYAHILSRSPEPSRAAMWILVISHRRNNKQPALFWKQFLEDVEGEFKHLLGPLSSLMSTPAACDNTSPITFYHKSLNDFLSSRARCGDLYVERAVVDSFAADRALTQYSIGPVGKGPKVPIRKRPDLHQFLQTFCTTPLVCLDLPFLRHSTATARRALTLCDVAWWTRLLLRDLIKLGSKEPRPRVDSSHRPLLARLYCNIHAEICGPRSSSSGCHPACLHWRTGILAEAKAQRWCVHELEHVGIDKLAKLTPHNFDTKFQKMGIFRGNGLCIICRPTSNQQISTQQETSSTAPREYILRS